MIILIRGHIHYSRLDIEHVLKLKFKFEREVSSNHLHPF